MNEIIITGENGKTFRIDLDDPVQKRYELVRELALSSQKREDICSKFGYSRNTGNRYLNAWTEKKWDGIRENKRGPKNRSKRTDEIEQKIIGIRFKDPEKDMYEITNILNSEGNEISARSVARVLSEHNIT